MSAIDDFINVLRMERHRRRIKQMELAEAIGITSSHLAAWENLRYVPTDTNLRRWAAALDVAVPAGVRGFEDTPAECGTVGGYQRHRRLGEPTCQPCRRALADYMRSYRQRSAASPP